MLLVKLKISGHSMEPYIKDGESVLASNFLYLFQKPKINDIVVFKGKGSGILIKRITKIEKGKYFVEGDNKDDSFDSRKFGFISKDKILGKVIYKL